ncbi:hypothetical protein V6N00_12900 [Tersicoccus sp. MR15.9]|uniref:hypothetical protein n=1 Tax=Tersicoccus mangrovi TaxID=3121635 RepID=UPI002FE51730
MAPQKSRVGRPSKGPRTVRTFRLPNELLAKAEEIQHAEGYEYFSDFVAAVMAEKVMTTDLSEVRNQGELPIGKIA